MIKCPYCQATHVPNTVFCSECGCYLLANAEPKTAPLNGEAIAELEEDFSEPEVELSIPDRIKPALLRLKIGARDPREVEVSLNKPIQVGRVDPTSNIFPEIDVTQDGNVAKSVSRRHAQFIRRGKTVALEDLGSANGTFVNGKRLTPYLPEPLHNRDQLLFGQLPAEVKILEVSS